MSFWVIKMALAWCICLGGVTNCFITTLFLLIFFGYSRIFFLNKTVHKDRENFRKNKFSENIEASQQAWKI